MTFCNLHVYLFIYFIWNLETKYNAKAMSTYRHHSTYKLGIWQYKGESIKKYKNSTNELETVSTNFENSQTETNLYAWLRS